MISAVVYFGMTDSDFDLHGLEPDEHGDDASREREQKLAALREFRERTSLGGSPPGSLTSLYLKERRALRRVFPGTLADLARDGIIKVRVLGEDGWKEIPDQSQSSS